MLTHAASISVTYARSTGIHPIALYSKLNGPHWNHTETRENYDKTVVVVPRICELLSCTTKYLVLYLMIYIRYVDTNRFEIRRKIIRHNIIILQYTIYSITTVWAKSFDRSQRYNTIIILWCLYNRELYIIIFFEL